MYTSFVLVAFAGSLITSQSAAINWQQDYVQARTVGQTEKKPLAVFIGTGAGGHEKVSREGSLSADVLKMLEKDYICVYVDVSTQSGQKLAADFAINRGMGLVLSDRSGQLQAFSHNGDLSTAELSRYLQQFSDPNVVVRNTTTTTTSRVSMYPSNGNGAGYVMYGSYPGSFSNGSIVYGGGCPGGNCGGVIRR